MKDYKFKINGQDYAASVKEVANAMVSGLPFTYSLLST